MQVVEQEEQALLWDAGARQEQEHEQERNSFASGYKPSHKPSLSGHKPSPLQCLVSASLPCFMILYDTLGIPVRLEVLGFLCGPMRPSITLYFVLLAWQ